MSVAASFLVLIHISNFPQKEGKDFPNNSYISVGFYLEKIDGIGCTSI